MRIKHLKCLYDSYCYLNLISEYVSILEVSFLFFCNYTHLVSVNSEWAGQCQKEVDIRGSKGRRGAGRGGAGGRREKRGRDEGEEGTDEWRREQLWKTREEGEKETLVCAKHAPLRDGRGRQGGCR